MKRLLLVWSVLTITHSLFAQKQVLGFNLAVGHTYYLYLQSSSNIKENVNGQPLDIDMAINAKNAFEVTAANDTAYDITVTYQELGMTLNLPGGKKNIQLKGERHE